MPNENVNDIFKKNLKKLLIENNITSKEFSEKIGVKASTVSMWLTGKNCPRMEQLDIIADFFNIPTSLLLTGKTNVAQRGLNVLSDLRANTIAAHFDSEEYTEEELEEIRKFAEFVKSQRKDKQ